MTTTQPLIVQKYGGATLSDPQKIKQAAHRIWELQKSGARVVAVVSAMGQTTNQLIELAHQVSPRPSLRELDMLLTTGERISMSLLSMALNDLGCAAISFTGSQAGILTDDSHVNARILDVKAFRVEEALQNNKIVILAGFQGVSQNSKEITTLGRGGSDISAVAMAAFLKADRCEILKDVASVCSADPKLVPEAFAIHEMGYVHLLEMTSWGAKVLHSDSVQLAADKGVCLYIGSAAEPTSRGTLITPDCKFTEQKILGINSFGHILKLKTETGFEDFQIFLQKNQIGRPRLLADQNFSYITAADEILTAIKKFAGTQNHYQIIEETLASVSATFTQPVSLQQATDLTRQLQQNEISVEHSERSQYGLHFFVQQKQKQQAMTLLHSLI